MNDGRNSFLQPGGNFSICPACYLNKQPESRSRDSVSENPFLSSPATDMHPVNTCFAFASPVDGLHKVLGHIMITTIRDWHLTDGEFTELIRIPSTVLSGMSPSPQRSIARESTWLSVSEPQGYLVFRRGTEGQGTSGVLLPLSGVVAQHRGPMLEKCLREDLARGSL